MKSLLKIVLISLFLTSLSFFSWADDSPDYLKERLNLATSEDYQPYALQLWHDALLEEFYNLISNPSKSAAEINVPLHKLSEMYPLGIEVNRAVAGFLEYIATGTDNVELKKDTLALAQQKKDKAEAILQTILSTGNGLSPKGAYQVINIMEEYAVLDSLGLEMVKQDLVGVDGSLYDALTCRKRTGENIVIYFDISLYVDKKTKNQS